MAQFTNQAQLTYSNGVVNSNVVQGELLEVLSATKTALRETYTQNGRTTYAVTVVNGGANPVTGITVTDNLGGYTFNTQTLTPLDYVDNSVRLFIDGALAAAPTVTENGDGTVTFGGITLPGNSNAVLVYETDANQFAPLDGAGITNTATVIGTGILTPVTATETVTPEALPRLTITKSIEPVPVVENGTLTYRFVIENFGNVDATADDNISVTDTFNPILENITVSYNGTPWAAPANYTYDEDTGLFTTVPGQITVPAGTFAQDPVTGAWVVTPGAVTLVVTGTV